jgi:hypothetical protein
MVGAFAPAAAPTTSTTALPSIYTAATNCPLNKFQANTGNTYDKWNIPFGTPTCNAPAGQVVDLTVTPAQVGCNPGTCDPGKVQNTCT